MFTRNLFLKLSASAFAIGTMVGAAAAQEVTLRMHQFLPGAANVPAHILEPWADRIEEASDGRIKIDRFHAMQLGGTPPGLIDQAIDGTADIIWTLPGYTPGRFPGTEVFELPFMMEGGNAEAASRAFWTLAQDKMMDQFSDVHVLGLWVHGPGIIHSSDPIEDVSDLNGVKLRAPTRVTNMMFSGLGATAVGMPVPAVPEALSQGVISATVIPWEVTGALRVAELVENHTTFGDEALYTATFILAMNKDAYNALPDDLQAVIDDNSGLELSGSAGRIMQEYDAPARELAEDLGNNIIDLSPEQVEEWRTASQATIDAWVAEMDAAGKDGSGLLAAARRLISENQ